jgi:hypothetical protein
MVDYQAVKTYFKRNSLSFFTFFPKSEKPIKAVTRHLLNTPAQDISNGLVDLGFDVISVKQMSSARRSPDGCKPITLPLFLVTLPRTAKSPEIFKLSGLCHICIKVEAYKSQSTLTQCFNCQKFGHVWANCKQPPCCMWCVGSHLHKDCPEKGSESLTPACCNCQLAEGERLHPANYRGCKLANEEMRKKKPQRTPKTTSGRVFTSNPVSPHLSFAAARQGQGSQPHQEASDPTCSPVAAAPTINVQKTGQSVQTPTVSSDPENMFRACAAAGQSMAELKDASSEEAQFLAIAKIVFNLIKHNGK